MADRAIPAESSPLTEEDLRKRHIVKKLMRSENKCILDFAKHLSTVSFSAIGIVLALKEKWLTAGTPPYQSLLLGIAIALFLVTGVLASLAASSYMHGVSLSDYTDVDAELHRVARTRSRLTLLGLSFSVVATVIVAVVAIRA